MSEPADTSAMLSAMSACAYRLAMAFGREAERVEDWTRKLELVGLFDRCFFSVRVATGLQLRLRREGGLGPRAPADGAEDLRTREAATDHAATERDREQDRERDRDRESEPASLPVLLKTLNAVAAGAAALPGPPPAELPTLRELLARMGGAAAPAARPRAASEPSAPLRARLSGVSAAAVMTAPRPPAGPGLRPRPATGPPRR